MIFCFIIFAFDLFRSWQMWYKNPKSPSPPSEQKLPLPATRITAVAALASAP